MKTYHGNLTPKSLTLRDRDASFSSYLQPHHHHTIGSARCRGLDDSTSELSIFDAHKYFNEMTNNNDSIQKVTTISSNSRVSPLVNNNTNNMDAEHIIPERGNSTTETTRYSSASSSVDGYANKIRNFRASSFHAATPTAFSEASWNSQAGLLSHSPGAIPVSMMRNPPNTTDLNKKLRASLSKPIWLLRRKCPCSGKKSVQVKEKKTPEPKTKMPPPPPLPPKPQPPLRDHHSINLKRQDHEKMNTTETLKNIIPITHNNNVVDKTATFVATTKSQRFHSQRVVNSSIRVPFTESFTFPVLNPHSSTSTTKLQVLNGVVGEEEEKREQDQDPARDSLEVFQPPNNDAVELPTSVSPKSRVNVIVDDDAASDASSDLFEIESFSTTATQSTSTYPMMCRRRDSIDDASSSNSNNNNNNNGFFFGRGSMDEVSTTPPITECYEPSEASIEWSVTTAEGFYERAGVVAGDESSSAVQGHGGGGGAAEKWKRKGGNGLLVSCRCEKAVSVGPQPVKSEGQRGTTFYSRHVMSVSSSSSNSRAGSSGNKPPLARSHNTARMSLAFAT